MSLSSSHSLISKIPPRRKLDKLKEGFIEITTYQMDLF
jgi:hypothetical protein